MALGEGKRGRFSLFELYPGEAKRGQFSLFDRYPGNLEGAQAKGAKPGGVRLWGLGR